MICQVVFSVERVRAINAVKTDVVISVDIVVVNVGVAVVALHEV